MLVLVKLFRLGLLISVRNIQQCFSVQPLRSFLFRSLPLPKAKAKLKQLIPFFGEFFGIISTPTNLTMSSVSLHHLRVQR